MIDGITKPFELRRAQLSPDEVRTAAAAYIAGINGLFERFDPQTNGANELDFRVEIAGDYVRGSACRSGLLHLVAPDVQLHFYDLDEEGIVRRSDSRTIGSVVSEPDTERAVPRGAPVADFVQYLSGARDRAAKEQELGMNNQPVDAEEVRNIFNLLAEAQLE